MQPTKDGPNSFPSKSTAGSWNAPNVTTKDLAQQLSRILSTFVMDRTGLTGSYDIDFQWPPDGNPASLVTAMEQQLGLKLESANGMAAIYVIDKIDEP